MTLLADIEGHISSMSELGDIVGAMRSLAGMRVQEAQRTLPGIRYYTRAMKDAVGTALLLMAEPRAEASSGPGRRALILCAAEHGFVGSFNEHLLTALDGTLQAGDALFILGSRGAAMAFERGRRATWTRAMASRPAGVPDMVGQLTAELYGRIARGELARVEVMFTRCGPGRETQIERDLLLPLDTAALLPPQRREKPLHNLAPPLLLEQLLAEYMFARLTEAAVESIASENAARYAAMESARNNVGKKLDDLRQQARQARQTEITSELLDLIVGAEMLTAD